MAPIAPQFWLEVRTQKQRWVVNVVPSCKLGNQLKGNQLLDSQITDGIGYGLIWLWQGLIRSQVEPLVKPNPHHHPLCNSQQVHVCVALVFALIKDCYANTNKCFQMWLSFNQSCADRRKGLIKGSQFRRAALCSWLILSSTAVFFQPLLLEACCPAYFTCFPVFCTPDFSW